MNPRQRRLVIPVALGALLLIVLVAVVPCEPGRLTMATEPLLRALSRMRGHLLDPEALVRAVASGAQRGGRVPEVAGRPVRRVELRYVDLKAGRHLQVTSYDDTQAHTTNVAAGDAAKVAVDDLLDQPFGNWHVDTTTQTHQVRATKKLEAVTHTQDRAAPVEAERGHDKAKQRLLARGRPGAPGPGHLRRAGPDQADPAGEVPPGRGVPAAARRGDRRRAGQGTAAHARPRTTRCGSSTSAAATPT